MSGERMEDFRADLLRGLVADGCGLRRAQLEEVVAEMDRARASEAALREENERLRGALQRIVDLDHDAETRDIAEAALSKEPTP